MDEPRRTGKRVITRLEFDSFEPVEPSISVCFAYCDRVAQFERTLESFAHWYSDIAEQIEFCVVDDTSSDPVALPDLLGRFPFQFKAYRIDRTGKAIRNPGVLFNYAVEHARSSLVMLTNPENMHLGPVIKHALAEFVAGQYLVYGCRTLGTPVDSFANALADIEPYVNRTEAPIDWYQHSQYRNVRLHFCTVIEREAFIRIGGFDPAYDDGYGFEDDDLLRKIERANIPVRVIDEPHVAHQWHPRPADGSQAWNVNQRIFDQRWQR